MGRHDDALDLVQQGTPSNPDAGRNKVYAKSDGKAYILDSAGAETLVGPGTAPTTDTTGVVKMFAGSSAPSGYLICDGAAVSRTTYATLFALIGTTYGVGNGSTTFNVPNMKGRVPVGVDSGQTEFDTPGETGGAKTHTLTTTEMPAHTHTVPYNTGQSVASGPFTELINAGAPNASYNSGSQGGGGAHNNLQPFIALNFIIKT